MAIYFQDLNIIFNDALQDEATSYILAIPLLFAYLIYRKRKMLRVVIPFEIANQPKQTKHLATLLGILLCTTAIMLYWRGSYTFTPLEYHILTLPIFATGLTLILFNPQTLRQLAFPITFLMFLMPPPSEILYSLGSTLSVLGSEASNTIVNALGIHSTISSEYGNPTLIITKQDQTTMGFTVDIACSGIYSLIGFLIFAAFIAYITRDKTWKKTAIFLLGLPLIYSLNIIRITIILLIGYQYGEQPALQIFHLMGGWTLIFLGTLLLLTITEKIFKTQIFAKPSKSTSCENCNPNPRDPTESFCSNCGRLVKYPKMKLRRSDIAKMVAIAAAVILLLSIQAPVVALLEGPAPIIIQTPAGEQGNTQILPQIPGYTLEFIYRDKNFEKLAKQNASLLYDYIPLDRTKEAIYVAVEISSIRLSLHHWESCLISQPQIHGYQPEVTQLDLRDIQILQNPPIIARYFAFLYKKYNQTQIVLYWFETSTFAINNTAQKKFVKISLIAFPDTPEDMPEIESQLATFAIAIASYWEPIKTWAQITMLISKNGSILAAISTATLASILIIAVADKRKEKKNNANAYQKLSKQDQQIIEAVYQTQQETTPSLSNIATTYTKLAQKSITNEELLEKLNQATLTELIKKEITNQKDEPLLAWKSQVHFQINKNE